MASLQPRDLGISTEWVLSQHGAAGGSRAAVWGGLHGPAAATLMIGRFTYRMVLLTGWVCSVSPVTSSEEVKGQKHILVLSWWIGLGKWFNYVQDLQDKCSHLRLSPCLLINIVVSPLLSRTSDIISKNGVPPIYLENCFIPYGPRSRVDTAKLWGSAACYTDNRWMYLLQI